MIRKLGKLSTVLRKAACQKNKKLETRILVVCARVMHPTSSCDSHSALLGRGHGNRLGDGRSGQGPQLDNVVRVVEARV